MQDEDIDRAVDGATAYVNKQMQPADLVALVSAQHRPHHGSGLHRRQARPASRPRPIQRHRRLRPRSRRHRHNRRHQPTTAPAFAADDTEFNSLNTDRELLAIRTIAKSLERVDQKKSMLYFSGGLTRNGIENQASLRAATNAAARANMAIYSVDTRGLQALPPVGDASARLPARQLRLLRCCRHLADLRQSRLAGDPRHPLRRYRRQGLLRLQRLRTRLPAGPA